MNSLKISRLKNSNIHTGTSVLVGRMEGKKKERKRTERERQQKRKRQNAKSRFMYNGFFFLNEIFVSIYLPFDRSFLYPLLSPVYLQIYLFGQRSIITRKNYIADGYRFDSCHRNNTRDSVKYKFARNQPLFPSLAPSSPRSTPIGIYVLRIKLIDVVTLCEINDPIFCLSSGN